MCLTIFTEQIPIDSIPEPQIADHDIICYKLFLVADFARCPWKEKCHSIVVHTPYMHVPMETGVHYVDTMDFKKGCPECRIAYPDTASPSHGDPVYDKNGNMNSTNVWEVGVGMIHSFVNLDDAINESEYFGKGKIIMYAIIPKGAKYYKGYYNKKEGYASSEIIITENAAYYKDYEKIVSEGNGKYRNLYEAELSNRGHYIKALHIPLDENWFFDYDKMKNLKLEDLVYDTNRKESLWKDCYI